MAQTEREWREELDAMIAAGWGDVPQGEIPIEWRSVPGPDVSFTSSERQRVSVGLKNRWRKRKRSKIERLKRIAAEMREKYLTVMRLSRQRNIRKRWEMR